MSELILAEFDKPGIYNEVSLEEFSREDLEEENVDKNIADDLEENIDKNVANNLEKENVNKNVADDLQLQKVDFCPRTEILGYFSPGVKKVRTTPHPP